MRLAWDAPSSGARRAAFAEAAILFFFSLLLARVLGPASYGLYALGMSLAGVCCFLTLLGLGPETLGRFLPEIVADGERQRANGLLRALLAIRSAAIILVACLVFIFRGVLSARLHFPLVVASLAAVLVVFAARSILDLLTNFSSGLLDLRRVAVAKLAAAATAPILFVIFVGLRRAEVDSAWLAIAGGCFAGIVILMFPLFSTRTQAARREPLPLRANSRVRDVRVGHEASSSTSWATTWTYFFLVGSFLTAPRSAVTP